MKFGINAQVIIALLGALYILMVCREKYRIEYAEGEPVTVDEREPVTVDEREPVTVDERETEVYSMIRDGRLTPDEAADELANLRDAGVSLTSRSISVLNVLGLTDKARAEKKMKEGPKLTEKERLKLKLKLDGEPTSAVMPKPGSPDYLDEPRSWLKRLSPEHKGARPGIDYTIPPRSTVMPKPGSADFILSKARRADEPRLAVMPKPGSADFIVNKVRRADELSLLLSPESKNGMDSFRRAPRPLGLAGAKAKKTSVAKAPIVAVKAEKNSIIEEEGQAVIEEEATIEGQAMIEEEDIKYLVSDEEARTITRAAIEGQVMIEEEGMSTGAIVGITAVSIVALIAIMITMRRLRR